MGNLGGVIFALIFRFESRPFGKAFWVSGVVASVSAVSMLPYYYAKSDVMIGCKYTSGGGPRTQMMGMKTLRTEARVSVSLR